jgi:hypothetical protein
MLSMSEYGLKRFVIDTENDLNCDNADRSFLTNKTTPVLTTTQNDLKKILKSEIKTKFSKLPNFLNSSAKSTSEKQRTPFNISLYDASFKSDNKESMIYEESLRKNSIEFNILKEHQSPRFPILEEHYQHKDFWINQSFNPNASKYH